jgi:predicted TIM-barrel fold metal-dependent hydrolase
MAQLIDWHAHHTAPELAAEFAARGARAPRVDDEDSPDFARRVAAMDSAGVDVQLVCQGAVNADRFPAAEAGKLVELSNAVIAERIAPFAGRLFGILAVSLQDIAGSVEQIHGCAGRGFRAVLLYAQGEMLTRPETEPLFAAIAEARLPIFLHGGGQTAAAPGLDRLEDGGQGVVASAHADAGVSGCVARMIAAGLFDRYPQLQVVIRSGGGGLPLLLSKLYWKHHGPSGEQRYSDVLLEHFLVDCASVNPRTLQFLIDTMGEERVVFGSDFCGGLGPLQRGVRVIHDSPHPEHLRSLTERNALRLLHI